MEDSAVFISRYEVMHVHPELSCEHQVMSYLLNEWLYTVKCILDVLVQLWVT